MNESRRAFSVAIFARHTRTLASGAREVAVLLVKHKRLDAWLPCGGEIEPGETPLEAAERELREETSMTGRFVPREGVEGSPPGLVAYEEHMAGSKGLHMNFCFVAEVEDREIVGNEEFSEHRWVLRADEVPCPRNVQQLLAILFSD